MATFRYLRLVFNQQMRSFLVIGRLLVNVNSLGYVIDLLYYKPCKKISKGNLPVPESRRN